MQFQMFVKADDVIMTSYITIFICYVLFHYQKHNFYILLSKINPSQWEQLCVCTQTLVLFYFSEFLSIAFVHVSLQDLIILLVTLN